MKSHIKSSILTLYILSVLTGCTGVSSDTESTEEKEFPVRILTIQKEVIPRSVDYTANLLAWEEVHYAPASPGRITSIEVEVGERITKGQVLVEMDKTQLQQALLQYQNALSEFSRIDTLQKLGSISEQQYELVRTQYDVAKTNVDYLRENTTLVSPLNGIVTGRFYESGEIYAGSPNATSGKAAIVSLMQINPLKAQIDVAESYFPIVKSGMTAKISTDIYPGQIYNGRIYLVHPTIDPNSRTFRVEVRIDNPGEVLRPGMFARVNLQMEDIETIIVPANTVIQQEGTNNRYVFIHENGIARRISVTIGQRFDDKLEIISDGIEIGTELISSGQMNILDGSAVSIVQ